MLRCLLIFVPHEEIIFLSGASRRTPPRLATPGKKGLGPPTSDRHPRALKGIGCGPTSITSAPGIDLFALPRSRSCGPHFRAGGHPSPRSRPVAPDTSSHTAPSARALRHVTGDKYPTRRMSDSRQWDTPDLFPQRDFEKPPRSGMSAQEACKALKYRVNDGSGSPALV